MYLVYKVRMKVSNQLCLALIICVSTSVALAQTPANLSAVGDLAIEKLPVGSRIIFNADIVLDQKKNNAIYSQAYIDGKPGTDPSVSTACWFIVDSIQEKLTIPKYAVGLVSDPQGTDETASVQFKLTQTHYTEGHSGFETVTLKCKEGMMTSQILVKNALYNLGNRISIWDLQLTKHPINDELSENRIESISVDHEGTIYLGTDYGLWAKAKGEPEFKNISAEFGFEKFSVKSTFVDQQGTVYLLSYSGLWTKAKGESKFKNIRKKLFDEGYPKTIYVDAQDTMYVGGYSGLFIKTKGDTKFKNVTTELGLSDAFSIESISVDSQGTVYVVGNLPKEPNYVLWIKTKNESKFNNVTVNFGLEHYSVSSIFVDGQGTIYIGGYKELFIKTKNQSKFVEFNLDDAGLPLEGADFVSVDNAGVIYLVSNNYSIDDHKAEFSNSSVYISKKTVPEKEE